MPVKKRVKVSQKRDAIRRLNSGTPIETLAAEFGVSSMTIRNWSDTYSTGAPASAGLPPTSPLQQRIEMVPLPAEVERIEEKSEGGYEAARAAAGLGPEPQPQPEAAPPPEAPKPEAPKIDPAQGLIFMSKIGLQLSVRFYAAKLKVKLTDQVKGLAKLSDEEEAQLETYAPFAAPYISELLTKYGPVIGAGIYGFLYFTMLTDRFAALKEMAPKKEPEPEGAAQ